MCLAKAYKGYQSEQPFLSEIARLKITDGQVELETLLGERMAVEGEVREIDFSGSRVIIES
jgi:predicted RNA-binding protein